MVNPVSPVAPGQSTLTPEYRSTPYSGYWWTNSYINGVPADAVGWLVAQGWTISDITWDTTTSPKTPYYQLRRQSLQNWYILQSLLNSYTVAYNEAMLFNTVRYNDVVEAWSNMLASATSEFSNQSVNLNDSMTIYIDRLDTMLDDVEADLSEAKTNIESASTDITNKLGTFDAKLASFESNFNTRAGLVSTALTNMSSAVTTFQAAYDAAIASMLSDYNTAVGIIGGFETTDSVILEAHATDYEAALATVEGTIDSHSTTLTGLLDNLESAVTSHVSDMDTILGQLQSDHDALDAEIRALLTTADSYVTNHAADYASVLGLLSSDYTTHAVTARAFLTGLGTTELARINEQFDNLKARTRQELVDRGLYSSALVAQSDARVERERNEAIAALNDKLNREKLEDEHRLFGQQEEMRTKTLEGKDRVFSIRQEVLRYKAEAISRLYGQLQEARARMTSIRDSLIGLRDSFYKVKIEVLAGVNSKKIAIEEKIADAKDRLYALRSALLRWKGDNRFKLEAEVNALRNATADKATKTFSGRLDAYRTEIEALSRMISQCQEAVAANVQGQERSVAMTMQNAQFLAELRYKLAVAKMEARVKYMEGVLTKQEKEGQLLKYQLDTQNNLLIGLFGFVEKREDEPPTMENLIQLCTGLGDAGGGWVTP